MKYTYSLVEAAALWANFDPAEIQKRIDENDRKIVVLEYEKNVADALARHEQELLNWNQQRVDCASCLKTCPEWRVVITLDGDERAVLDCPNEYFRPCSKEPPEAYLPPHPPSKTSSRSTPNPGEFAEIPEFEMRLAWLHEAEVRGDLPVVQNMVRRSDLRVWLEREFPGLRPTFLYPDQAELENRLKQMTMERDELLEEVSSLKELANADPQINEKSKNAYLGIIGTFLLLLAKKYGYRRKDKLLMEDLWSNFANTPLPPGLSDKNLERVFAASRRQLSSIHPDLKDI